MEAPEISNFGRYIGHVILDASPEPDLPLHGLTAVVKDSFDVKGHPKSNGSPVWWATHPAASQNAAAVQALLDAGATVVGKCVMDEMAYSLQGDNAHYGTPINPACPDRLPGGSSSGTAAAIAAGDADVGLGGDTGGSVRVPASFCGILGIRPTHNRVSMLGDTLLAPTFSTAGWFARDPALFRRVGAVLLDPATRRPATFMRWLLGVDAFAQAAPATATALQAALALRSESIRQLVGAPQELRVGTVEGGLLSWMGVFRVHQGYEVWQQHGEWVRQHKPDFGPGIKERFEVASGLTRDDYDAARQQRAVIVAHLHQLLGEDGVLVIPSAPCPAPLVTSTPADIDAMRRALLCLTCIAGLGGLPQVSLPLSKVDGCPVGLSIIGPPGSDEDLLELAERIMALSPRP